MPSLPSVFVELRANASQFQAAMQSAQGELKKTADVAQSNSDRMAAVGKVAFAGLAAAAIGFGTVAVKAFMDHQKVAAQTEAVLTSTGNAANVTAAHVDQLATSIGQLSGIDDEAVQAGENMLLTFTNIKNAAGEGNDVFDQSTRILADMSVALGTDMATSAIRLGKALNDPVKGVTALTRVGVTFTDQQKEQIKTLAQTGHVMDAQKIILAELNKEFGGSAEAAGKTFAGQLGALRNRVGDVMEAIGGGLVPVLTTLAGAAADAAGFFAEHQAVAAALAGVIGGPLVAAMTIYITKQAIAFGESVATSIGKVASAIFAIVPAVEAAEVAESGLASTTALATGGLSILGAGLGLAAAHFLGHSGATKEAASSAAGFGARVSSLSGDESDLGDEADDATASLKAQQTLFKDLSGDVNAQAAEVLKLISDQQNLDKATKTLNGTTKDQTSNQRDAARAATDLGKAQDKLTKVTETYNKLQEGLGNEISKDQNQAHHDLEQAQLNHEGSQKKLTQAVAEYGENSDEARQASLDLESATFTLTAAQDAMGNAGKSAWDKVNDAQQAVLDAKDNVTSAIDKQREAIEKINKPAGDAAANTLAWQQAQNTLNTDWDKFMGMIKDHPEMRDNLVSQIRAMRDALPKGADTKPLDDLLNRISKAATENLMPLVSVLNPLAVITTVGLPGGAKPTGGLLGGVDLNQILAPLNSPVGAGPVGGPSLQSILTGGSAIFGGGAAEGAMVKARPGGTLMLVGEGGRDEVITPLGQGGAGAMNPTIIIQGYNGDARDLAIKVRDELLRMNRNMVGVGLG